MAENKENNEESMKNALSEAMKELEAKKALARETAYGLVRRHEQLSRVVNSALMFAAMLVIDAFAAWAIWKGRISGWGAAIAAFFTLGYLGVLIQDVRDFSVYKKEHEQEDVQK